jgi:hypothetical protein
MLRFTTLTLAIAFLALSPLVQLSAQTVDEDQLGAWYMYFYNHRFGDGPWGVQGDFQFRFWEPTGDLEQILLRSGLTYTPEDAGVTFTLGYANITTGEFGESDATVNENRIYQEALFGQTLGSRFLITHRMRFEQRWNEGQDLRTRYRYMLFVNIPLNATELARKTVYIALYNELFINGERSIGGGREVELFDRNRTYTGLGYNIRDNLRTQLGWMLQTTDNWAKGQLQFSLHHSW